MYRWQKNVREAKNASEDFASLQIANPSKRKKKEKEMDRL